MNALEIREVQFRYPGRREAVLTNAELAVAAGEVYCLAGPNGVGKTTLIGCIMGFVRPQKGRIVIAGVDALVEPRRARSLLGHVPENVSLWDFLTGLEHVALVSHLLSVPVDAAQVLAEGGLPEQAWRQRVATYSKGMRQKLALVLALLGQPKVAILDEPTSGLDPEASHQLIERLRQLARDGVAVLAVSHDVLALGTVAHRVGFMRGGRIEKEVQGGDAATLVELFRAEG